MQAFVFASASAKIQQTSRSSQATIRSWRAEPNDHNTDAIATQKRGLAGRRNIRASPHADDARLAAGNVRPEPNGDTEG